jgi:hypothetical protein
MIENDCEFLCPHCGEPVSIRVDKTAGEEQSFIYDCEVCCRPIKIQFEVEEGEIINFTAEADE